MPDPSFGADGVVRLDPLALSEGWAVRVLPDGRLRVAGVLDNTAVVYGFEASGAPDAAFGVAGVASTGIVGMHAVDLLVFPSGRIVVVTRPFQGSSVAGSALVGLRADGTLDPGFGDGGAVPSLTRWLALAADGDGFLALGHDEASRSGAVARFDAHGALDLSYGTDGRARPLPDDPAYLYQTLTDIAVDASGRAVLIGVSALNIFDARLTAVRLLTDGAPDPDFGTDGIARPEVYSRTPRFERTGLALDTQGRVLMTNGGAVARLDAQGLLDLTFGTQGVARVGFDDGYSQTSRICVQPDGKIVVAGDHGTDISAGFLAARLTSDGVLDETFGTGGMTLLPTAGVQDYEYEWAFGLDLAPDGGIVLSGHRSRSTDSGDQLIVARLTGDVSVAHERAAGTNRMTLRRAGANPSAAGAVALRLSVPQALRLEVYDARGRSVGVLHEGWLGAGEHAFAIGGARAPGVYVVRAVSADGPAAVVRVTVTR